MIRSPVTLWERLAAASNSLGRSRSTTGDAARLRTSILTNLRRVLGTRTGNAPAQLDLGTPAPSCSARLVSVCKNMSRAWLLCACSLCPVMKAI